MSGWRTIPILMATLILAGLLDALLVDGTIVRALACILLVVPLATCAAVLWRPFGSNQTGATER